MVSPAPAPAPDPHSTHPTLPLPATQPAATSWLHLPPPTRHSRTLIAGGHRGRDGLRSPSGWHCLCQRLLARAQAWRCCQGPACALLSRAAVSQAARTDCAVTRAPKHGVPTDTATCGGGGAPLQGTGPPPGSRMLSGPPSGGGASCASYLHRGWVLSSPRPGSPHLQEGTRNNAWAGRCEPPAVHAHSTHHTQIHTQYTLSHTLSLSCTHSHYTCLAHASRQESQQSALEKTAEQTGSRSCWSWTGRILAVSLAAFQ